MKQFTKCNRCFELFLKLNLLTKCYYWFFLGTLVNHWTSPIGLENSLLRCQNCSRGYKKRVSLIRHLRYECGGRKNFSCHICPSKFTQSGNLRKHLLNIHNVSLPHFKKRVCGKAFWEKDFLQDWFCLLYFHMQIKYGIPQKNCT